MNPCDTQSVSDPFVSNTTHAPYAPGALDGLTFALKDNMDVAGEIPGYGSPGWKETRATEAVAHAICMEQLLGAGAIYKGKTISDELAYSLLGVNAFYGTPVNPKAPDRIPGGSSSGSASAVAGGRVDFALGTDTGGSVRVPASNCGLWGYRPSHGLISLSGVLPLAPSYDTVGVMARNGEVLDKVIRVLLADDGHTATPRPSLCFVEDIFHITDAEFLSALTPIRNQLSEICPSRTATMADITAPHVDWRWLFENLGYLLSIEIWNSFGAWVTHEKPTLSPGVESALHAYAKGSDRKDIQRRLTLRQTFQRQLNDFLNDGNILCFPTTVAPAPRLSEITPAFYEGEYIPRAMGVNAISGMSSAPQITMPVAEAGGIPVGLSFVAGYGQDRALMALCNDLYTRCAGH
ncbi:amidase family protein [Desulfoluna butyratoxydans]|uniref:Amidase n=1 Tax=Desulfoluna butyratoxydans TaxID=231438 RepID=A0A4U8YN93_9BACT|nr:amidase family protein [Desulfoluna butyratoxydans]VFQ44669.1 amidase [Desulfoluna butyratoxydans]